MVTREDIVKEAREWVGKTRFAHHQRTKGVAADCAGILAEVYERTGALKHFDLPDYPPDWWCHSDCELYLEWLLRYARPTEERLAGNIAMFSLGQVKYAHSVIITEWPNGIAAWPLSEKVWIVDCEREPHFHNRFAGCFDVLAGPIDFDDKTAKTCRDKFAQLVKQ